MTVGIAAAVETSVAVAASKVSSMPMEPDRLADEFSDEDLGFSSFVEAVWKGLL